MRAPAVASSVQLPPWRIGAGRELALDRPRILGILNVTPDSFSDGGAYGSVQSAVAAALRMLGEGADIIDVGGESTRPGAHAVREQEQVRRTVPVIESLRSRREAGDALVSIDTTRSVVAQRALEAGADIINDTSAASDDPRMFDLAAERGCGLILMHRWKKPVQDVYSTQYAREPDYGGDVYGFVLDYLGGRIAAATARGVPAAALVVDPGLGFGKSVEQNRELSARLGDLQRDLGRPVLSAVSRKSFLARWHEQATGQRADPSASSRQRIDMTARTSLSHWQQGVRLFRVHDVAEHAAALGRACAAERPVQHEPVERRAS